MQQIKDKMTNGYLAALMFAEGYDGYEISDDLRLAVSAIVSAYCEYGNNKELISLHSEMFKNEFECTYERFGMDLYYVSHGHGVGFFDYTSGVFLTNLDHSVQVGMGGFLYTYVSDEVEDTVFPDLFKFYGTVYKIENNEVVPA